MPAITLADAQQHLADWLAADTAVSKGQAYSIAGRAFTRSDAAAITEKIKFWQAQVSRLSQSGGSGLRMRHAVPA